MITYFWLGRSPPVCATVAYANEQNKMAAIMHGEQDWFVWYLWQLIVRRGYSFGLLLLFIDSCLVIIIEKNSLIECSADCMLMAACFVLKITYFHYFAISLHLLWIHPWLLTAEVVKMTYFLLLVYISMVSSLVLHGTLLYFDLYLILLWWYPWPICVDGVTLWSAMPNFARLHVHCYFHLGTLWVYTLDPAVQIGNPCDL